MERLSSSKKVGYGFGNLGFSAVSQTISTILMFFGTSVAGIPGTLVGLCVAIGTFWDAVTDPIVGYISSKRGITVHRADCLTYLRIPLIENRSVNVEWDLLK